jgi:(5-formylfuran-3-yl)methyl phosphate synthase
LLVSIRNANETALALAAKVDWIDLKEPVSGPLGRPSREVLKIVGQLLANHHLRSAALGEFRDLEFDEALYAAEWFPFLKVGLSGLVDNTGPADPARAKAWISSYVDLTNRLRQRGTSLIPVLYADHLRCSAPSPREVVELAQQVKANYLLIDTYVKDGKGLFHWMTSDDLNLLHDLLAMQGCRIVLAGSLAERDLPQLAMCQRYAIAVRGAVCMGDRHRDINPDRLEHWVRLVRSP